MEDANGALFAEEWQHSVRLRLQSGLDVDVTQALSGIGSFRTSDTSLVIVFIDSIEVYWLVQERCRHRLLVNVLRFKRLP